MQFYTQRKLEPRLIGHGIAFALCAGVFVAVYILSFYGFTGMLPFGAGYARLLESIDVDSIWIGGFSINVNGAAAAGCLLFDCPARTVRAGGGDADNGCPNAGCCCSWAWNFSG